jgi:uncharacterized protein YbjT (DUF2867 family)
MVKRKKILVIGATQGTGFETVQILLNDNFNVRIFARNEHKAKEKFGDSVETFIGDLQNGENLPDAVKDIDHIIFTAGVTRRPCGEELIVKTEFDGIRKTIEAAQENNFAGKFLFLSSIGVETPNWASKLLNLIKGNALTWRLAMEDEIRRSGFDYVILRAGYLMDGEEGKKPIELSQNEYPLYLKYRIARRDVARILVEALRTDEADNKTFDAVWNKDSDDLELKEKFARLQKDQ